MPTVRIKDVPEDTHRVLRQRAAAAHQSLQEYLRSRLIEEASRPTMSEVLTRASERTGGSISLEEAADLVRAERDRDGRPTIGIRRGRPASASSTSSPRKSAACAPTEVGSAAADQDGRHGQ